jgi:ZIP family zinc transporter
MGAAIGWGALAASSLVIGALLAFAVDLPKRQLGIVLAFGAGALISAVSFELAEEGLAIGGVGWTALGLAAGALVYFTLDGLIARRFAGEGGTSLALGAFLDGIPEQLVLGIGLASGGGVSVGLLVAIFVSNLPESIGSAREMETGGGTRGSIVRLWIGVAFVALLSSIAGYALGDGVTGEMHAVVDGFAAGALLVMLVDSMIPDAREDAGRFAGLATVLGFAVAAALSSVS